jgi:hypothetical protein
MQTEPVQPSFGQVRHIISNTIMCCHVESYRYITVFKFFLPIDLVTFMDNKKPTMWKFWQNTISGAKWS